MSDSADAAAVRVALVGAGLISDLHIQGLRKLPGVEITALADPDLERARARAARHAIPGVYPTQADLLRATTPDVVHLLTPPSTHADLAVEALEAGAHVYVEKPMAATVGDCDRMIAAAARSGRRLCVGHSLVFDPLFRQALAALERGEIGDVIHAAAVYDFDPKRIPGYNSKGWYRRLGGGFVEDLATHPASTLLRVLGRVRRVTSAADQRPGHEEAGITALIEAERGTGVLLVSLEARPEDVSLEVRGTRGVVRVNFTTMVVSVQREGSLPRKLAHGARNAAVARDHLVQTFSNTARFVAGRMDTTKGIHTLIAAFYQALRRSEPAPVDGEAGREVVRLLRAIWPEAAEPMSAGAGQVLHRPQRWGAAPVGRRNGGEAMTALVTGATGFIGTHLVRDLTERGVRIRALARSAARGRILAGPNVEVVIGDLGEPETAKGITEDVDVVFHLASIMGGTREEFERVDLAGGRRLLEEARCAGVRRFVFTSTMAAYATAELGDGARVTEAMVDLPDRVGEYARAKLLMERSLMEAHRAGELEAVVVRPGLVFGPGASPFLEHLPHLGSLKGNRYLVFGDGKVPLQLTYVGNTVEALWHAAMRSEAAGEAFTIVDDDLPTQREFVAELARLTGRPLRVTTVPRPAAYMVGLGVEILAAGLRRPAPTSRRLLLGKTRKLVFDTTRAKQLLGWRPDVSWKEGLRCAVSAWAQTEPLVAGTAVEAEEPQRETAIAAP